MLQELAYISEWIAAIAALIFYKKYKHTPIKTILWILWITVAMESCARIPAIFIQETNHLYYNCYLITVFPLLFYTIYKHTLAPKRKKSSAILSSIAVVIMIVRALNSPFSTAFMIYMHSLAMITLLITLLIYAIDLLKDTEPIVLRYRLELFVFTGFLLFGISYVPLSFFVTGNSVYELSREALDILYSIQMIIVLFMYLLFVFGFVWSRPAARMN